MIGALTGDIIGSIYEWQNIKTTDFPLFGDACRFTDDSVLTVALADALLSGKGYETLLRAYYHRYPDAGYGGTFRRWATGHIDGAYNSWGNGAAMRISPVAWAFDSLEEVLACAEACTVITHSHPEGVKGAQATASAIFLARSGSSREEIRRHISATFRYDLSRTCEMIRPAYRFDVSCQGTVPEAIIAFLDSSDFESAIRLAISLGGDSDTLACITGSIAEAFYGGVPPEIAGKTLALLTEELRDVTLRFATKFMGFGRGGQI
ncbi:ADP-ribosylglycohydrolase family protein [Geomonas sp. RF6]|uniref:ADP-ribosylglycohydrolase family protein n=1 Tax=Geomonas sp. RF6 TaxID=2897342 RepID=UPI001E30B81D|nr:ADP-ribosylglycohydrolase family protein [Geomonas sp. RF6]UFS69333.1 ADP-ribosylglycohydrolase family protein [Geomonas sp. RF6]